MIRDIRGHDSCIVSLGHVLSSKFCAYDGVPLWFIDKATAPAHPFPWPLKGNASCSSQPSGQTKGDGTDIATEASVSAYQDIFDNHNGMLDDFSDFWAHAAEQFKDKAGKDAERASVGLFTYPVLQAADILAYKATHVPVGEDQKQHLELSRDIADRFNREYDVPGFFPLPEPLIKGPGARIMSLKDGTKKMSKSDPSDLSRINLVDDADLIAKKIKKAKTDLEGDMPSEVKGLEGRPEVENLVGIYSAVSGQSVEEVLAEYGGKGFGVFKPALADVMVAHLAPITQRFRDILADQSGIDAILRDGAERANAIAAPIMEDVRRAVGYWRP